MAPREFTHDYYAVLQVSEDADENTIKASYKRLALRCHPDRSQLPNATAEFQKVQEAYEVLKDPHQRFCFNAQLPRIRRDAPAQNSTASNHESYFYDNGQPTQLYEQSIYQLERKLSDLRKASAQLQQDRDAKIQQLQQHKAAIQRFLKQDYEAAKDDDKRNTWMSFLTMNGYTRSEKAQRQRAASLRSSNRRDQEDIVRHLEAERDRLSAKLVSLSVEISQMDVQKRGLETARRRQSAAKAKAEEQKRQPMQEQQNAAEKARKAREEQLKREEQLRREEQLKREEKLKREAQLKREAREQLIERARLAKKEKEEQKSRERQQRMAWEAERRHAKESYQSARTREHTKDAINENENGNCKHRKFWTKVQGRIECERCHFIQRLFAFRCPGCHIFACANCRDLMKNGPP